MQARGPQAAHGHHVTQRMVPAHTTTVTMPPHASPPGTTSTGKGALYQSLDDVDRMWGDMMDGESANWSERMYQRCLPAVAHLPGDKQRHWTYLKLWPNLAFDIYPDQVDFMQWLPTGPTTSLIREISYALPDDRREMRAARYLNWRINRQVNAEDTELISRVQQGMQSRSFSSGPLSEKKCACGIYIHFGGFLY